MHEDLEKFVHGKTEAPKSLSDLQPKAESPTFGMKAVGISFNPGGLPAVDSIKQKCANVIDELYSQKNKAESGEAKAMFQLAIRAIQDGQMWGVKAATWKD